MKILIIGLDTQMYGSAIAMKELAVQLKNKGEEVYTIIPQKGLLYTELYNNGIPCKIIHFFNWIFRKKNIIIDTVKYLVKFPVDQIAEFCIYRFIIKNQIDIVHINTIAIGAGAKAAKKGGCKLVWHLREMMKEAYNCNFHNEKMAVELINQSDKIIAISNSVKEKYEDILSKEIEVVYDGVDSAKYYLESNSILTKTLIVFVCIGRISRNKRQADILYALQRMEEFEEFEVWFAGEGDEDYIKEIKHIVKTYGWEKKVLFKGYVADVKGMARAADIAIVAAANEGFGRVTVEAMMEGLLVIGSEDSGTKEIIKPDTGILYRKGDVDDLKCKIEYALENREKMRKIARNGQAMAISCFDTGINAQKICEIYKELGQDIHI